MWQFRQQPGPDGFRARNTVGRGTFDYGESSQSGENPRDNPSERASARGAKEAEMTREMCAEQDPMAVPH